MSSDTIKIREVTSPSTIEVMLSHAYPLMYTKTGNDFEWVIVKGFGASKHDEATHLVGSVMLNDLDNKILQVFGGPMAGMGLSHELSFRGINKSALAKIPWNYIKGAWILTPKEIPIITEKHGRFSIKKTKVIF